MTTIRYGTIRCNGCGTEGPLFRAMRHDHGAVGARQALRKKGWRRVPGRTGYGADYCPRCVPNHPEAK